MNMCVNAKRPAAHFASGAAMLMHVGGYVMNTQRFFHATAAGMLWTGMMVVLAASHAQARNVDSYEGYYDTETINESITIVSGGTIDISEGATLTFAYGLTINSGGALENNSSYVVCNGVLTINSGGEFWTYGGTATFNDDVVLNGGILETNYGTITFNDPVTIEDAKLETNNGTITFDDGVQAKDGGELETNGGTINFLAHAEASEAGALLDFNSSTVRVADAMLVWASSYDSTKEATIDAYNTTFSAYSTDWRGISGDGNCFVKLVDCTISETENNVGYPAVAVGPLSTGSGPSTVYYLPNLFIDGGSITAPKIAVDIERTDPTTHGDSIVRDVDITRTGGPIGNWASDAALRIQVADEVMVGGSASYWVMIDSEAMGAYIVSCAPELDHVSIQDEMVGVGLIDSDAYTSTSMERATQPQMSAFSLQSAAIRVSCIVGCGATT